MPERSTRLVAKADSKRSASESKVVGADFAALFYKTTKLMPKTRMRISKLPSSFVGGFIIVAQVRSDKFELKWQAFV